MFSYEEIQKYNETDIRIYKYIARKSIFDNIANAGWIKQTAKHDF